MLDALLIRLADSLIAGKEAKNKTEERLTPLEGGQQRTPRHERSVVVQAHKAVSATIARDLEGVLAILNE